MIKITKILLTLLTFLVNGIYATTTYVSSADEINSVMLSAQPGDTLIMTKGIWRDQGIKFRGFGTVENPIVLKAEEGGHVFLTGKSYLRISGEYLVVDGLHFTDGYSVSGAVIEFRDGSSKLAYNCRLTNTAIVNYNPESINTDYKWVSLYGQYNRVDHCYFEGKNHSGTTLVVWMDSQPDYHLIDNNYFAERPDLGFNGGETIRIGTSDWSMYDSKCIVEYNMFEHCDGETEIISNKSCNNIYRYNTFYESKGTLTLRHGNSCDVYGNFFFGNGRSNTGGIRIIGEDHRVYNNYLEKIEGSGYRAAICMVKGVANSPLNRYFQVKNAQVVNNTIVNCDQPFAIGYGSDSDQTLPPQNIRISNNVAYTTLQILKYYTEPENAAYSGNVFFSGPVGVDPIPEGISTEDPQLELAADGLLRPLPTSPLIDSGDNSFDFITEDMDGQSRAIVDIGADEFSNDPIIRIPITSETAGPNWLPIPVLPKNIISVNAGQDSLLNAVAAAPSGAVLQLISDGGSYFNSQNIIIDKNLTIRAKDSLVNRPVVMQNETSSNSRAVFEIHSGGNLILQGIEIDGGKDSQTPASNLIQTAEVPFSKIYALEIKDCLLHNVGTGGEGYFFRAYPGTKANQIKIENSILFNSVGDGIVLAEETAGSGNYNTDYLIIKNSTFYNIPNEAVKVYAGDNIPFTPGPKVIVDHCTFYNCGFSGKQTISPEEADSSIVKNSIFSNCSKDNELIKLSGFGSEISYSTIFNSGWYSLERNAIEGKKVLDYDPFFESADNFNFALKEDSPVLLRAAAKAAMGDLRWAINSPTKYPLDFEIVGNGRIELNPSAQYDLYDQAANVTVTAIPDSGFQFENYSGDINSTNNPLQIMMFGATEITAQFDKINSLNVTEIPEDFKLYQNYPNPFNPTTKIEFDIPHNSNVKISVFNLLGEEVITLVNHEFASGSYQFELNGNKLSSGIYLVRLQAGSYNSVIKINLLR